MFLKISPGFSACGSRKYVIPRPIPIEGSWDAKDGEEGVSFRESPSSESAALTRAVKTKRGRMKKMNPHHFYA
jgi:hypothetical protein